MKKFFVVFSAVLVLVVLVGTGCEREYENSGSVTESYRPRPDGGYDIIVMYENQGSSDGYYNGNGDFVYYDRSGYNDSPVRVPSAPDVSYLVPAKVPAQSK